MDMEVPGFFAELDEENDDNQQNQNALATLDSLLKSIEQAGGESVFTVELLDPHGHSMIIDGDASERELTAEELEELPIGPDPAVFSPDDAQ